MSNVFEKAVDFAMQAHAGQTRKDGSVYILHPLEVAVIIGSMTDDLELLAAGVLHDTVEDTPVTAEDILENFGERVAFLVARETENKRHGRDPAETWKIRKEESLEELRNSGRDVKMLWLGDKLSNLRSLVNFSEKLDGNVFDYFNQKDPKEHRWYHEKILEYTGELSNYPAYKEYRRLFEQLFIDTAEGETT